MTQMVDDTPSSCSCWVVLLVAVVLGGCGSDEQTSNAQKTAGPCADVTCEVGICDPENGECIDLQGLFCKRDTDCRPGYVCGDSAECVPATTCSSDGDCDPGVCEEGVCVNPETCERNDECLPRSQCAFREGAEGTCVPESEFCEVQTCGRGLCSSERGRCVDARDCEGDEANCLPGNYCSDRNRCRRDLCEENDVECADGGVCVPKTGTCENADSCESTDDCREGHVCVEGTCRLEETACGDAGGDGGCPANRVCQYDEKTLEAECVEPDDCETSFDCDQGRRCTGRDCRPVAECRPDGFEPNDRITTATSYAEVAYDRPARATLCPGDVDVFEIDTNELPGLVQRSELRVEANIATSDRGLGELDVELRGPDDELLDTASTGAGTDGRAETGVEMGIADHGVYTVRVSAADGMSEAGLTYELTADSRPPDAIEACEQADKLALDRRTVGTISRDMSRYLDSRCSGYVNPTPETVYRFELEEPQQLQFQVADRGSGVDWTMSLYERCTQRATERRCSDDVGSGRTETMTETLEAGTYHLVVQPAKTSNAYEGEFAVTVGRTYTTCGPGDHYCGGREEETANICAVDGSGFREVACSEGCDPSSGRCRNPGGDTCLDTETVGSAGDGERTIDFSQYTDQYRLLPGSCEGNARWGEGGADRVYRVEVPSETVFRAEATFSEGTGGGVYLAERCPDIDESCLVGDRLEGDDRPVSVEYPNTSKQSRTMYLVVQIGPDAPEATADLQMGFDEIVCESGYRRCSADGNRPAVQPDRYGGERLPGLSADLRGGGLSGAVVFERRRGAGRRSDPRV